MLIIIGIFFVGLSGCSSPGLLNTVMSADSVEKPLVSAQDHLTHVHMLEQDVRLLEEEVSRINQKVARYERKPYLDPKRFRRDGLKILRGSNLKKIETLREKVAWHRAQASRLAGLDSSRQDQAVEDRNNMNEQASLPSSEASPRTAS
jgi:hypothetical protein